MRGGGSETVRGAGFGRPVAAALPRRDAPDGQQGRSDRATVELLQDPAREHRHPRRPIERCVDVQAERSEHRHGQRERRSKAASHIRNGLARGRGLRQGRRAVHPAAGGAGPGGGAGRVSEGRAMLLAGDIGGTKTDLAVFSVEGGPRAPIAQKRFPSRDYASLEAIAREFIAEVDLPVTHACFAVAGPVVGGSASLTNLPWIIEESSLQAALGLESVSLLNDVQATAVAVPHLRPADLHTVREGTAVPGGTIAVIAPGTGLGEAFLTWDGTRYRAYPSEGSHTDFGPRTPREIELLRYSLTRWERVSYERVCAGQSMP